ncbi:MAG: M14 family metallopeptidase [Thermoanaerobaculia bacterium]
MRFPSPLAPALAMALVLLPGAAHRLEAQELPAPQAVFGHPVGADRQLVHYDDILDYLRLVASDSNRISIEELGTSTLGADMIAVVMTSAANQADLEGLREISRRLRDADRLDPEEAADLAERGKAILLVTCTIHSTEVGCTQMAAELAYEFATTRDPHKLRWMDDVVLVLIPSINPDGQNLVIDWYEKYLGTPYEGGPMPWLYHHYVGHDDNRDYYMLTQDETRIVNSVLYGRWFPQVFIDEHQMGRTGPRMFVPPQTDPLAPEVHSLIFRMADLIGTNMSYRLEEAGRTGVGHNMIFDSYWPGGTRNTAWWKNVTGLLTEVASARIATPIRIEPGELEGGEKGFPEYTRRANFPSPWPGGWWRLRDIVDYELTATWAALETCSQYRAEILHGFYRMGREAAETGASEPPYAWILPPSQHDPVAAGRLVSLLLEHGVRVEVATEPLHAGLVTYPAGTHVVPADQPYRAFLLTMLRPQRYPEVVPYEGGPIIPPYDVTSWSLPLSMGVQVDELDSALPGGGLEQITQFVWPPTSVTESAGGHLLPHAADSVYVAMNRLLASGAELYWLENAPGGERGDVWVPPGAVDPDRLQSLVEELHLPVTALATRPNGRAFRVRAARVGLFKPWVASIDEGWTRFLLDRYEFPYRNLVNEDIAHGDFASTVDVLLLPDVGADILRDGRPSDPEAQRYWEELPPEYAGGIGPEGADHLASWIREGGSAVALDSSGQYLIDLLQLPVTNVLTGVGSDRFAAPGTTLRLLMDTELPLAWGLAAEEAGYFASSPAYRTAVPDGEIDRRVVARYPDHRDDIPVSGYILGAELLERRAAVVDFGVADGRALLIGFRAQHRAQTLRTFKLLFNALYRLEETSLP